LLISDRWQASFVDSINRPKLVPSAHLSKGGPPGNNVIASDVTVLVDKL
jgi:hypothetical protein